MKSINLIFNSGVMIFLLLVLDSAVSAPSNNQVLHAGDCNTIKEGDESHLGCKKDTGLACTNAMPSSTIGIPDRNGDLITAAGGTGKCTCLDPNKLVWVPAADMCVSEASYHTDYKSKKDHAATCTENECKPQFKCHAGTAGAPDMPDAPGDPVTGTATGKCLCVGAKTQHKDGKCLAEVKEVEHAQACNKVKSTTCKTGLECVTGDGVKTGGTTPDTWGTKHDGTSATDGKCACATSGHVFGADKMCKAQPVPPAVDHSKPCGGATKIPCKDIFKCHKDGAVKAGKADKQGTLVAKDGVDPGVCVCEGKNMTLRGKVCGPADFGPDNAKAGSDRIVYQPTSLQLSIAAIGSLCLLLYSF